jgi:excisionase family DNA binding protein
MSETWLSVKTLAEYLGVSKETIYRKLKSKTIPAYRIGKLWRFKKYEIDLWTEDPSSYIEFRSKLDSIHEDMKELKKNPTRKEDSKIADAFHKILGNI